MPVAVEPSLLTVMTSSKIVPASTANSRKDGVTLIVTSARASDENRKKAKIASPKPAYLAPLRLVIIPLLHVAIQSGCKLHICRSELSRLDSPLTRTWASHRRGGSTEGIGVEIPLQMIGTYRVVYPADTPLY